MFGVSKRVGKIEQSQWYSKHQIKILRERTERQEEKVKRLMEALNMEQVTDPERTYIRKKKSK